MKAVKIPLNISFSICFTGDFSDTDIAELDASKGAMAKAMADEILKSAAGTPGVSVEVTESRIEELVVVDF